MAELLLTLEQNGGRFAVRVGDAIVISVPENAAAGYRWTVASPIAPALAVEAEQYRDTSEAVGSAGLRVWRLRAVDRGEAVIALKKARPWEPPDRAAERWSVRIAISG